MSGGSQGALYQGRDFTWIEGGSHIHVRSGEELVREGAWSDCPYLGLAPFLQRHARVFYGRDTLAERLVERLMTRLPQGMLVVVGASGAGKSSLLQAGLLPLLARGELGRWPVLSMTPTGQPLRELAHGLARMAGVDVVSVHRSLRDDPQAAPQLIEQVIRATRTRKTWLRVSTRTPVGVGGHPEGAVGKDLAGRREASGFKEENAPWSMSWAGQGSATTATWSWR